MLVGIFTTWIDPEDALDASTQILRQLFQTGRLPFQHFQILRGIWAVHPFLLQQIHIVDNRGQRRFNIVRHIGNQLRLQAFALHLPLQRHLHAIPNTIQRLSMPAEVADQIR